MMGWNMMGGGGGMFFGGFLSLLVLIAVIVLAVRLIHTTGAGDTAPSSFNEPPVRRDEPLRILQTRYASGEIGREEFETMRSDLETGSSSDSQIRSA